MSCLIFIWHSPLNLNVLFAGVHRASLGVPDIIVVLILGRTRAAEEPTADEEQPSSAPANVERGPQLPLLSINQGWVVEIPNDCVGRPADGDEDQDACDDEGDTCCDGHSALSDFIWNEVGALASHHAQQDSNDCNDDGDDNECSGGLQILRQFQKGIINLALHLACALSYAVHPQTLPYDLRGDDVGADEGRDFPGGEATDDDGPQQADKAQSCTQDLSSTGHHDEAGLLSLETE